MFTFLAIYTVLSLAALVVLARMILAIGEMLGDCPDTGRAARSAAVTIATGYSAVGTGGVLIIGAALPLLAEMPTATLLAALGLAAICLGLGFTSAVTTLRAVVADAADRAAGLQRVKAAPDTQVTPDKMPNAPA